jgi:hypothetical protein
MRDAARHVSAECSEHIRLFNQSLNKQLKEDAKKKALEKATIKKAIDNVISMQN